MKKALDYVSDYHLESACKDAPCIAPSRVTKDFGCFSGLISSHHPTLSFKLVSFLHICL